MGVETRVVHDVVSARTACGREDTFDWYAQDDDGNVWYFGEDTTEFEDGTVEHDGSWEAGVDGALPGIVMPATPRSAMTLSPGVLRGRSRGRAKVLSLDASVSVPYGQFTGALETEDTTPLEPDVVERKFYVRDIGPVLALQIDGESEREELVSRTPG